MRAWKFACAVLCVIVSAGGIWAQNAPPAVPAPIATVDAGDFRALTVSANGRWMMVADAATDRLRIYDIENETPVLVASPTLDGTPVDAVSIGQAAIVAVDTGGRAGLAQIVAPIAYDPAQPFAPVNWIDLADRPRSVSASPDGTWAIVVGSSGYTVFEIGSLEEVTSTFYATPIADAALLPDVAFLADRNTAQILTVALGSGAQATLDRSLSIPLDAPAQHLALNLSGTLGAAALSNGAITLFDPQSGEVLSTFEAGAAADVYFLSFERGDWLVILAADRGRILLYDVSTPSDALPLPDLDLPSGTSTIQAITTFGDLIFAADRSTVRIWRAAQP